MMGAIRAAAPWTVLAGLALIVALELNTTDQTAAPETRPAQPVASGPVTTPPAEAETRDQWVATILARPLFASDRRPQAVVAAAKPNPTGPTLPRLAGILVVGDSKRVIFAGTGSGRPLVLAEGADVSGFRVQSIEPERITLVGPDGVRTLLPSFDPNPAAAPAPPPQAAAFVPALPSILPPPNAGPPQAVGIPSNAALANGLQIPGLPLAPPGR